MNEHFRSLCIAIALVLCSSAQAQISYDGYEALYLRIYFEHAGERDGEFKLLFQAYDERGVILREWIRPDSNFLGFHVTLVERAGVQTAFFRHPDFPFHDHVHVPIGAQRHLSTARGTFAVAERGDAAAVAYVGDEIKLGGITATVRNLSPIEASLTTTGAATPTTLPISSVGALRTQHYQLQKEFFRLQSERWRADSSRELSLFIQGAFIFLFATYAVVYSFIFIGWLTRDKHLEGRNTNDRNG